MLIKTYTNADEAFTDLVTMFDNGGPEFVEQPSRNGVVRRLIGPAVICYINPRQRVLFNRGRDANPFFHLYEALWMLAGSNQLAPVQYYCSNMAQFSDDGHTLNGAYGFRWRRQFDDTQAGTNFLQPIDQLTEIVEHLKHDYTTRRAVLQMWDAQDLLAVDDRHERFSKDVCCNLSACFYIRDGLLDMTVFNRSNDLVLGMLGANIVHFSMLQEYVANCINLPVGRYHQVSANLHAYIEPDKWKPSKWLARADISYNRGVEPYFGKLVMNKERFDEEVKEFVKLYDGTATYVPGDVPTDQFNEPFLNRVAVPMCEAFYCHKHREYNLAHKLLDYVAAPDWRAAGRQWLAKREANYHRPSNAPLEEEATQ